MRVEHVKPSRCKEEFLKRSKENDEIKHEAKQRGGKQSILLIILNNRWKKVKHSVSVHITSSDSHYFADGAGQQSCQQLSGSPAELSGSLAENLRSTRRSALHITTDHAFVVCRCHISLS